VVGQEKALYKRTLITLARQNEGRMDYGACLPGFPALALESLQMHLRP